MSTAPCGCPNCDKGEIQITLTVADQRKLVEADVGEPCVRIWLTDEEFAKVSFADWTAYPLQPGLVAIWRKRSDIDVLLASTDMDSKALGIELEARVLVDVAECTTQDILSDSDRSRGTGSAPNYAH